MRDLRLFCNVAKLGSISKAAAKHGVSQSAVSQRIRQFEMRLGVQLLDRTVRPFQLTDAGELLLEEGSGLYSQYCDLIERVSALEPDLVREIQIDAIYSAGIGPLRSLGDAFHQRTGVKVLFSFKRPEEVADSVRAHRCDFGIISYPKSWRDLKAKPLRNERMTLVCAAQHPLARRRKIRAKDLGKVGLVGFEKDLPVGRSIRRYLREHGHSGEFLNTVDNIDTMKSMILEMGGVAILPSPTVRRELGANQMAVIALEPVLERPMGIVVAPKTSLSAAAREFFEVLVEQARSGADQSRPNPRSRRITEQ